MGFSAEQIVEELYEHNDFFDMIVDMIPSKLYIAGQSGDDYNPKNRYYKGVGAQTKQARKAAAKTAKRQKLDPSQAETTVEKKKRLDSGNDDPFVAPAKKVAISASPRTTPTNQTTATTASPHKSRIEALRAKLHAKIAEMQGQRPLDPNLVSKRAARRAEKRKRQEDAAKRKKQAATKVPGDVNDNKNFKIVNTGNPDPSQDLATLDFGKLAGLNVGNKANYLENNKALANLSKTKNLQKMLADAESKRKKLEEWKRGSEEDKAKAEAMQWADTLKEADGHRIKDDPAKLKKALKKKAAKKAKSQKAWKSRMDQVKDKMDERQKIRQHNLSKRKEGGSAGANLSRKAIKTTATKAEDEGRKLSRAGFEGRKQDFLNTPKEKKVQ